jgi:hypothetical protein
MSRLEQLTGAGHQVKVQWDCEFQNEGIAKRKSELLTRPIVQQSPLRTRDVLYGGRTEAMRLHYKARENEKTIQYADL